MGKPLHFKGSAFHRVIPQFMCARASRARAAILVAVCTPHRAVLTRDANRCQGGDFTAGNGTGAQPRSAALACEACLAPRPQLTQHDSSGGAFRWRVHLRRQVRGARPRAVDASVLRIA